MRRNIPVIVFFIISLLLYGGFYDWTVAISGAVICLWLLWFYHTHKEIYKKEVKGVHFIPEIIFLCVLLTSIWAVDRTEHIAGIMRMIVLLLWLYFCRQWEQEQKAEFFLLIPNMGMIMTVIGGIGFFFQETQEFFWKVERFGGFFQYANTCALFLFLGIIVSYDGFVQKAPEKRSKEWYFSMLRIGVLLVGILMTGSRSIILIGLMWGIYHSICSRKFLRLFLPIVILVGTVAFGFLLSGSGTQNIARIFTLLSANSTWYGRLLYDIDACAILAKNPLGLGYMGYYYVQHAVQTGVYTTRFVHNELLQMGLDYGVIAMILLAGYLLWQIIAGKQQRLKKEILIFVLTASLMDFHLQYLLIDYIVIMCLDTGSRIKKQNKKEKTENKLLFAGLLTAFSVMIIPYLAVYTGNYKLTLQFLPAHTEVLSKMMEVCKDKEVAVEYANYILQHNLYVTAAYNVKTYAAAIDGDIEQVLANGDAVLRLEKYDVSRYRDYDSLLEQLEMQYREMGQEETAKRLSEKRDNIRTQLADLQNHTSEIAYKLRDVPIYTW